MSRIVLKCLLLHFLKQQFQLIMQLTILFCLVCNEHALSLPPEHWGWTTMSTQLLYVNGKYTPKFQSSCLYHECGGREMQAHFSPYLICWSESLGITRLNYTFQLRRWLPGPFEGKIAQSHSDKWSRYSHIHVLLPLYSVRSPGERLFSACMTKYT